MFFFYVYEMRLSATMLLNEYDDGRFLHQIDLTQTARTSFVLDVEFGTN